MGRSGKKQKKNASGWLTFAIMTWGLALASVIGAIAYQRTATAPIGEGELFYDDTRTAAELVASIQDESLGVRKARNGLEVEAVSIIDAAGVIVASSSDTLVGTPIANRLLNFGLTSRRFAALAAPIENSIEIDGVSTWPAGAILYEALLPIEDGSAVMIHYDMAELLAKRAQPGEIQPLTIQLLTLGGIFAILGTMIFVGHQRSVARQQQMARESELLRSHARELEETNVQLSEARSRAEGALALAEEKMRIRSEFVLMINHELRTPLTSVVTGARLIRDGGVGPDERDNLIDQLVTQGERLDEIIDQILAVARIENRGLAYELVETPLATAAEAIGADVHTQTDPSLVEVRTDVGTLGLIVGSLSDNARTHGASNIRLSCSDAPIIEPMIQHGDIPTRAVYLGVTDDGPGIDREFLPRAFEKFEKNSSSSGTGLGLYMVRLMIDALGGSVGVTTSPLGTTFQIALPAVIHDREMEQV